MTARCRYCRLAIPNPLYKSRGQWRTRQYCNKAEYDEAMRAKIRRPRVPIEDRRPIPPDARRVTTWAGVPATCGHCGGLWRILRVGACCTTCGRDLFVLEALAGL